LDIRRTPAISATMQSDLRRVIAELELQWPQLPAPIVLPWSDQQALALDRGTPWIYGPADTDPLMGTDGPAVLPRRQRRQLARIAATGAQFDAIGVAHELDPSGPVKTVLPLLADGPRTCTATVARELIGPVPAHPGVARAAGALRPFVGGEVPARAVRMLDRLLDPAVFGVLAPWPLRHGVPSVWQPLVAWRW
jgi:hypothetical protein